MILLNILSSLLLSLHPFHVSVMSVHHAAEENSLQITLKLFADDLEEALNEEGFRKPGQPYIDVLNPKDESLLNTYIEDYLKQHLRIEVNGEEVKPQFLGKEMEELAMWCYFEVKNVEKLESLKVRSSIMTDVFDDQINIVHVNYRDVIKSMKLAGNRLMDEVLFSSEEG